jgi:Mce-associated membrane protein
MTTEVRMKRFKRPDPVLGTAIVLAVVAACCAVWFGSSWYQAANDESLEFARTRDTVVAAAGQGVLNMNTLDYRDVDSGLDRWVASTTGDLQRQITQGRSRFQTQVQQARTVTSSKILAAGVVELDDRAGKAGVIVAVQITVTPGTGQPATKQSRMLAQLTRTPDGWKLSGLGPVPVGS